MKFSVFIVGLLIYSGVHGQVREVISLDERVDSDTLYQSGKVKVNCLIAKKKLMVKYAGMGQMKHRTVFHIDTAYIREQQHFIFSL